MQLYNPQSLKDQSASPYRFLMQTQSSIFNPKNQQMVGSPVAQMYGAQAQPPQNMTAEVAQIRPANVTPIRPEPAQTGGPLYAPQGKMHGGGNMKNLARFHGQGRFKNSFSGSQDADAPAWMKTQDAYNQAATDKGYNVHKNGRIGGK